MKFEETFLKGNFLINLEKKRGFRGFFARYFCEKEFSEKSLNTKWVQINNSESKEKGTLRGLHYQRDSWCRDKISSMLKRINLGCCC